MKKLTFLLLLSIVLMASNAKADYAPDKEVLKAFELRMNGKVDEAKAMLEEVLFKDSTHAMAHYEMARLKSYMLTGGGGTKIDDVISSINKAVANEPGNVTYAYFKAVTCFINAYIAMQMGQGEVKTRVDEACQQFEKVLELKPDYSEAMLTLVEIYALLPADMGGDSVKAINYSEKLAATDKYFGAKAKAVLASESTDLLKYWEDLILLNPKDPEYYKEAGIVCLYKDDALKAEKYFDEAIKLDASKKILILNLGRYHMMKVMQNRDLAATELPIAKTYFEKYLDISPEAVIPLKAYTLGLLTMIERFVGNQEESDKLMKEASTLDKYFSRASAIPSLLLFDPPTQISHHYSSFFSPY